MLKPGSRLKSACDEVMVIKAGADDEVTCGGAVMATDVSEKWQAMMHTCTAASSERHVNYSDSIELPGAVVTARSTATVRSR